LQIVSALAYYYKQRSDLEKSKLYEEKLKALKFFCTIKRKNNPVKRILKENEKDEL
jgi:hypothetical protein